MDKKISSKLGIKQVIQQGSFPFEVIKPVLLSQHIPASILFFFFQYFLSRKVLKFQSNVCLRGQRQASQQSLKSQRKWKQDSFQAISQPSEVGQGIQQLEQQFDPLGLKNKCQGSSQSLIKENLDKYFPNSYPHRNGCLYGENGRDIRSMLSEWKVSWVVRIHVVVKPGFYLFVDVGELGTSLDEGNLRVPIHQSLAFLSRSSSGLMHIGT